MAKSTGSQTSQNWNPTLGDTEAYSVLKTLGELEQHLPFLLGLSPKARQKLSKVGERTRPFLDDALATALANPGIVPRSVDLKNLGDRATTLKNLGELKRSLGQLLEKVSDTETQLASDLYAVTRSVYAVMKTPVTVPGLNVQKDRLAKRFYRKARRQSEDTAAKAAA
jgi:hypothetical protein